MTARDKPAPASPPLVWERPEPTRRASPEPLSRDRIVQAALALADAEGLDAVSLRKVGAALNAGPMRLYGYLETKEELLELMVDAVYGEMLTPRLGRGDWRKVLRAFAHRLRRAAQQHPWFPDLLGARPHQGPSALAFLESALAALGHSPGFDDIDVVMRSFKVVNAYVIGAVRIERSEQHAERTTGMDKTAWQLANGPYLQRLIATGKFPQIGRVYESASHPSPDAVFDDGLDCILDGIAARLG